MIRVKKPHFLDETVNTAFIDQELKEWRLAVRAKAQEIINPYIKNYYKFKEDNKFPPELWKQLGKGGLLGITIEEKYGGLGLSYLHQAIVLEEIGYLCPGLALSIGAHDNLATSLIGRLGSEEQKAEVLPKLCSGEFVGALCMSEVKAGSDAIDGMETTAVQEGDYFILNGTKNWITNGNQADVFVVHAKTNGKTNSEFSTFIVPKELGVKIGRIERKFAMKCSDTAVVIFEDVKVHKKYLLSELHKGIEVMHFGLSIERLVLSGLLIGASKYMIELATSYSLERIQKGKPIFNFDMIKEKLATAQTDLLAGALMVHSALSTCENMDLKQLSSAACMAINQASTKAVTIGNRMLAIMGGVGYTDDCKIIPMKDDCELLTTGAGTVDIRNKIIASQMKRKAS